MKSRCVSMVSSAARSYLITYQAVQHLPHQAATTADVDPDRLSFTSVLRILRRAITTTITRQGQALTDAIEVICEDPNERRPRQYHRAVKRSQTPYPANRHTAQPTSTTVSYTIHINHQAPA